MKVRQYLEDNHRRIWMSAKKKHQRESYARVLAFCEFRQNGDYDIGDIRSNDVFVFVDHLVTDKGYKPATANRYKAALVTFFSDAENEGHRTRGIKVANYEESKGRQYTFTHEEVERIVRWFRRSKAPYIADMCILSYHTGMRLGEVLQIGYSAEFTTDEDGDAVMRIFDTKNGDDRDVQLSKDAKKAADALSGLYTYFNSHTFYELWADMRHEFGIHTKEFTFHAFRHTAATFMANELKMNQSVLQDILGHRRPETTARYIKTLSSTKKKAAAKMPRVA